MEANSGVNKSSSIHPMKECSRCRELFIDFYREAVESLLYKGFGEGQVEGFLWKAGVRDYSLCPDCRERQSPQSKTIDTYQYTRMPEAFRIAEGLQILMRSNEDE